MMKKITVKPVYNDYRWDSIFLAVVDMNGYCYCSELPLFIYFENGTLKKVFDVGKWLLFGGTMDGTDLTVLSKIKPQTAFIHVL
jgi:hypothetical protein